MRFISWKKVRSWKCINCGECCKKFYIPLSGNEYARFLKWKGAEVLDFEKKPGKIYLKRKKDGRCLFQTALLGCWLCGIQGYKPIVCKLFPFLISKSSNKRGLFYFNGKAYNVFLDRACNNIQLGKPSKKFMLEIIPEAIKLSLNPYKAKFKLTSDLTVPRIFKELGLNKRNQNVIS